jgi:membrane fusion protein (multidrug efflux system)
MPEITPDTINPPAKGNTTTSLPAQATPPPGETPRWGTPESRGRAGWLLGGIVLVLIVVGIFVWHYLGGYEATDDAQVDGHVNAISARVAGYITNVNITDNQYVEKGTVLVQIDPHDYQVAVERAKADLANAVATARAAGLNVPVQTIGTTSQISSSEAGTLAAQAGVSAAQQQLDAAHAQEAQADANNVRAQQDLKRYQDLVAKDEVSQQLYEQAVATAKANAAAVASAHAAASAADQQVKQAEARVSEAQAALRTSQTGPQQVEVTKARAQAALADVELKRAALDQAQLNLQYCTVAAPVSGVVNKNVEVGMNVQPGQTLLSIVPLDDVWITADFKETQLAHMRPGQRVTIDVDAFPQHFNGHVDSIAGASGAIFSLLPPENATGNYVKVVQRVPVKIVLDPGENKDHLLRLGMSVEPKVWVR